MYILWFRVCIKVSYHICGMFFCFLQIQCVLQDVGSHIATPRDAATEKKLRKLVAEKTKLVAEKTKLVAEDWLLSGL